MRSDRLMRGLHRTVSHDLPNELVAIHGLLQLLQREEADRLSAGGREYLGRLQNAVKRTGALARFLKEIDRVQTHVINTETVAAADLLADVQELWRQRFPVTVLEFHGPWDVPTIRGDRRAYAFAMLEVFSAILDGESSVGPVTVDSNRRDNGIELMLSVRLARRDRLLVADAVENTLEFVLAREWLALNDAAVHMAAQESSRCRIILQTPLP